MILGLRSGARCTPRTRREAHEVAIFGKNYGQEKNLTASSIARMNLVLHGIEELQIARGDKAGDEGQ